MQVTAEVVRAEPAWNGLAAAQEAARSLATSPASHQALDAGLVRIAVDSPAAASRPTSPDPQPVTVVIQYLRN